MMDGQIRNEIRRRLTPMLGEGEARAVTMLLFEQIGGLSTVDVLTGRDAELPTETKEKIVAAARHVEKGEPVQYIIGKTVFMGMELDVNPAVLIPRPETEDLVRLIISENGGLSDTKILDIGTGSGCIALAVKKQLPDTKVTAWDVSEKALEVALSNADKNSLNVDFQQHDILQPQQTEERFDIIVSNPPYVCTGEAAEMERQVLEYEPHTALFVPDDNPLLFYWAITKFAVQHLNTGGKIYFETNRAYAADVAELLNANGFCNVQMVNDQFGNQRIVRGEKFIRNNS